MDAIRTPDELLEGLPDFPFAPYYRQVDGLRIAHVDEGDGPPVVFFHGEPTWSFLWRKIIPPVRDAGFRCIAADQPGFGRSDKPMDIDWYSYDRHTAMAATLLEDLDLRDATAVVHDWGGPIGLRLAVEHPHRIAPVLINDTRPFTRHRPFHRPPAHDRRVEGVPRLRAAHGGPADRLPRARRLQDRPRRRGHRRLRRAVSKRGIEGRDASVPADAPDVAGGPGGRGGPARARG